MPHKVGKVMSEYKKGTLKSSSGKKVTSKKQAKAIGLSMDSKAHGKKKKQRMSVWTLPRNNQTTK